MEEAAILLLSEELGAIIVNAVGKNRKLNSAVITPLRFTRNSIMIPINFYIGAVLQIESCFFT